MRTRNTNSDNQLLMSMLFDAEELSTTSAKWTEWPEPQRSIYKRMFKNGITMIDGKVRKQFYDFIKKSQTFLDKPGFRHFEEM